MVSLSRSSSITLDKSVPYHLDNNCQDDKKKEKYMNTIMKKVVIVTGASSGIGKKTVLRFLKEGYEVHAGARRLDAMRDLEQQGAPLHALALTKGESNNAFVSGVGAQR